MAENLATIIKDSDETIKIEKNYNNIRIISIYPKYNPQSKDNFEKFLKELNKK